MTQSELSSRIDSARTGCMEVLSHPPLQRVWDKLAGSDRLRRAADLVARATALRHPQPEAITRFRAEFGTDNPLPESVLAQALLLAASLDALSRLPEQPVSMAVKGLFLDEIAFFVAPPENWRAHFTFSDARFCEMGRIATLQRFPAGQYHWEIAAFSRSWLLRVNGLWRAWTQAFLPMRGFGPLFELHLNDRRKNRIVLLESETRLSCYRAARSLELQPDMRGIMTMSWLYAAETAAVTPHLAWMRRFFIDAGAVIVDLGDAPADSGFMVGSAERRKQYEEGSYRPKVSCVLWPRSRVLRWAQSHPELDT